MAEITKELGRIPVSRGDYQVTTEYYKDNIVQYKRGSYQVVSESPIIGVPPTNDKNIVNPGWTLFAGTLDAQDVVNQIKEQEIKSIQAVAAREAEILAKSDAAEVSFDNTGTSLSGTNMQDALKETNGKLFELGSEINEIKGYDYAESLKSGYYRTNVEIGTIIDITQPPAPTTGVTKYVVIKCEVNDTFEIAGIGGNASRLWAFLDNSMALNSAAVANIVKPQSENFNISAPCDGWLIYHHDDTGAIAPKCYRKGKLNIINENIVSIEEHLDNTNAKLDVVIEDTASFVNKVKVLDSDVNNRILFNKEFVNNSGEDIVLRKIYWIAKDDTCKFYVCVLKEDNGIYVIGDKTYISSSVAGLNEEDVNLTIPNGCYVGIHGTKVDGETMPMWGNQTPSGTLGCKHNTFQDITNVGEEQTVNLVDLARSTAYGCLFVKGFVSDTRQRVRIVEKVVTRNNANFNSIREVVNSITDASSQKIYHIFVPKGRWFECDLSGKPYVKIIGIDREESIVYCDGDSTNTIPSNYAAHDYDEKSDFAYNKTLAELNKIYKHCIYCADESYFENLRIEAHNTKYCVHVDSRHCPKAVFENCHIYAIKDGNIAKELNHPVGIGLRGGQNVEINNCIIESEIVGMGVFAHNFANNTSGCKLSIKNSYFKNCGYLKTGELGSGHNDIFELINCTSDIKMLQAEVDATTEESNPQNVPYSIKVNACGTDVVAVQTPVVKGVVSRPNFVYDFMSNFALTMGIGDVPGCAIGKVYTGYPVIKDKYIRVRLASNEPQYPIVGVVFNVTDKFVYFVPKGHVAMIPVSAISSTTKTGTAYVDTNGYLTTDIASSVTDIGAIGVIYAEYNTSDYVYLAMF